MKIWAYCKDSLVQWTSSSPLDETPTPPDGFTVVELQSPLAAPPSDWAAFNIDTGQWVDPRPITKRKTDRWATIKAERQRREYAGFTWDGSTFDSDPISQSRIQGAVQLASLDPATFSIDWTLADNTVRTLSGANMVAVGTALAQHVTALHITTRGLRAQIEAATTAAEVDAVVWPA